MSKITVNRPALLAALNKALPGIDKGTTMIEGADTFVFDDGVVRTYNDNISISVTATDLQGLVGAVKASDFHKTISKLNGTEIEVEITPDNWKLKAGRSRPTITRFQDNITQFLEMIDADVSEWVPLPGEFGAALSLCFIPGNKVQKRGCFIEGGAMYSTDGVVLNRYVFEEQIPNIYLDDPAVAELLKLGKFTEINVGTGWVHFRAENDVVFSAKLKDRTDYPLEGARSYFDTVDNSTPSYTAQIPKGTDFATDRVAVFGVEQEGSQAIEFSMSSVGITLSSKRISGGNEEDIPWDTEDVNVSGTFTALINPAFLIAAVHKASRLSVIELEFASILVFGSNAFRQIVSVRASAGA